MVYVAKYWKYVVMAALLALSIWNHHVAGEWKEKYELSESNREKDRESFARAAAKAEANNLAEVRSVERKWQLLTQQQEKKYSEQVTNAHASVAAYVERMRREFAAAGGTASRPGVSDPADPSTSPDGAGASTVVHVSDLYICADNTVKAQSWQQWYSGLQAAQN